MRRFRGRSWLYGEAEYRVDLHRSGVIGAVAFVNTSTLSDARNHYGRWVPAGGIGLRLKLDKRHGSNLTVDYGWGLSGSRGLFLLRRDLLLLAHPRLVPRPQRSVLKARMGYAFFLASQER